MQGSSKFRRSEANEGTHQDPVKDGAAIDAITLGPDRDRQCPRNEDNKRLNEMDDVLGPSQVST